MAEHHMLNLRMPPTTHVNACYITLFLLHGDMALLSAGGRQCVPAGSAEAGGYSAGMLGQGNGWSEGCRGPAGLGDTADAGLLPLCLLLVVSPCFLACWPCVLVLLTMARNLAW